MAYMQAFTEVICGWSWDSDRQTDKTCLMGEIHVLYLKYENSTRGGLHAHGQACQPLLHTTNLRKLLKDGTYQEQVYSFFESFMCCVYPVPNLTTVSSSVRNDDDWLHEKCPLRPGCRFA